MLPRQHLATVLATLSLSKARAGTTRAGRFLWPVPASGPPAKKTARIGKIFGRRLLLPAIFGPELCVFTEENGNSRRGEKKSGVA